MEEVFAEYQGFDNLVVAEVTKDNNVEGEGEGYVTGAVEILAPAGEISKTTSNDSATKFYDNKAFLVINSEGSDEVSLTIPQLPVSKIAKFLGKHLDAETGALMDSGKPGNKYFAIGYRLLFTDGTYRYVWRHKGTFKLGDETAKSKDDTTDSNNQTITYTGITTNHNFNKTNEGSKAIVVDERDGKCDVSTWFDAVVTPDNITKKVSA